MPTLRRSSKFSSAIIIAFLCAGSFQYIFSVLAGFSSHAETYFIIDDNLSDQAGPLRYLKDVAVISFGIIWPIYLRYNRSTEFVIYFGWILSIVAIGSLPLLTGNSYIFFYMSGLRWVLLLHAVYGLYKLIQRTGLNKINQGYVIDTILYLSIFNALVLLKQSEWNLLTGNRLPGIFTNAGTEGYFVSSLGTVMLLLKEASARKKMVTNILCLYGAVGSGTRYAIIVMILVILVAPLIGLFERLRKGMRFAFSLIATCGVVCVIAFAIYMANLVADRGDLIESQLTYGGRIGNIVDLYSVVSQSGIENILFGQGLGVGTNTAFYYSMNNPYDEYMISWNMLLDNSFGTTFIQLGIVGSVIFWGGIVVLLSSSISAYRVTILLIFLLSLFVQNIAEQFFMMISFAVTLALDDVYVARARSSFVTERGYNKI